MKKIITVLGVLLLSILLFLLVPELIDWISTGEFQITLKDLRTAVFVGIFTPVVLYFSRKIKDDKIFVLVLVIVVVTLVALGSLLK
jgi:hypothetical protein